MLMLVNIRCGLLEICKPVSTLDWCRVPIYTRNRQYLYNYKIGNEATKQYNHNNTIQNIKFYIIYYYYKF